jgi:hypothetical protein
MNTSLQLCEGKILSILSGKRGDFILSTSSHTEVNAAAELNNIVFIKINIRCMQLQFVPIKASILVRLVELLRHIRKRSKGPE